MWGKAREVFSGRRQTDAPLVLLSSVTLILATLIGFSPGQPSSSPIPHEEGEELPFLKRGAKRPEFTARSIYVVDLGSGKMLFSQNPEEPVLPASTTKIATSLVVLSHFDLEQVLTIEEVGVDGQKMELEEGEEISVRNLLYGLLVFSANDAAEVLAQNYPGGRDAFVQAMNSLARSLGLERTHFSNPTGLDEYLHFSTAKDLATLAAYAVGNPVLADIVATQKIDVSSQDGKIIHELVNINQLVGKVPGVMGVKTGWTINSGESVIALVERDERKVLFSVLGSQDRFGETEALIDWVFVHYSWE